MDLPTILRAMTSIGSVVGGMADVKATIEAAIKQLQPADQIVAKAGLLDLIAGSDAGHARLQAKLERAANG